MFSIANRIATLPLDSYSQTMYIPQIRYPGTWLQFGDDNDAFRVAAVIRTMNHGLGEAAIALNWFEEERQLAPDFEAERELGNSIRQEAEEIASQSEAEAGGIALGIATERGIMPRSYRHRTTQMHARTFVYSLDTTAKCLGELSQIPDVPGEVAEAHKQWKQRFSPLRRIRDTAHHLEDRVQGKKQGGAEIDLKPVDSPLLHAPGGGVLLLDSLNENIYTTTTATGHAEEIEISAATLEAARKIVQDVVQAFVWIGPVAWEPSI